MQINYIRSVKLVRTWHKVKRKGVKNVCSSVLERGSSSLPQETKSRANLRTKVGYKFFSKLERISFWTNAEETNFSLIYYEYTYTRIVSNTFRATHGRKININLLLNKLLLLSNLHFYVTN